MTQTFQQFGFAQFGTYRINSSNISQILDILSGTGTVSHRFDSPLASYERQLGNLLVDMMLKEETLVYTGGAGSCAGCGEGTALRMMCAATGAKYKDDWAIVAATGCNTVYTSTYPYNPYLVPWTNSLFENAPAMAPRRPRMRAPAGISSPFMPAG